MNKLLINAMSALELRPIIDLAEDRQLEVLAIRNHPEVRQHMYTTHEIAREEHLEWIERLKTDPRTEFFAAFKADTLVGAASLNAISAEHERADWGFYIDPASRGASIGIALGAKVLDYAFQTLAKLNGEVLDFNERSIAFHKKLGFKREGVRRDHIIRDGRHHDVVMLGITTGEWRENRAILLEGNDA